MPSPTTDHSRKRLKRLVIAGQAGVMNASGLLLLSLLLIITSSTVSGDVGVIPALQLAVGAVNTILHVWHKFRSGVVRIEDIASEMTKLQTEMKEINNVVEHTNAMVYGLVTRLSKDTRLELQLNELGKHISKIESSKRLLAEYMKHPTLTEKMTLEDFARWCVSQRSSSIPELMERIHSLTTPVSEPGLINPGVHAVLLDVLKTTDTYMCNMQQSNSQLLYNMYNTILLAQIDGYAMMQFSWMILKMYEKGNFTVESAAAERLFEERMNMTVTAARKLIHEASRVIRRCEPPIHTEGETFTSLTRLLQGYIENEVDMNEDGTCKENCEHYQIAKNYGCFQEQFCSQQKPCTGQILNCEFIQSDMKICQAPISSDRRYEWIEYDGKSAYMYGKFKTCTGIAKVESWWRWLFWHCSYCMCICDQSGPKSDRYFSLKESLSDVKKNKIVTGIRFIKQDRIIHIQISEGTLLPGGKIDQKSVSWKKIEKMYLKSSKVNIDYHEMSYAERAMDLHELEGPSGHVMTGLRFRKLGGHLNLEVQTMPFNFATGELKTAKYIWISDDHTPVSEFNHREEVTIKDPDVPTNPLIINQPISRNNQFVKFTHTDLKKDLAQTTVPYLDTQPVMPKLPVPLSGAGVFYKGFTGHGGFVALNIITYDYSSHMEKNVFDMLDKHFGNTEVNFDVKEEGSSTEKTIEYGVADNDVVIIDSHKQ